MKNESIKISNLCEMEQRKDLQDREIKKFYHYDKEGQLVESRGVVLVHGWSFVDIRLEKGMTKKIQKSCLLKIL